MKFLDEYGDRKYAALICEMGTGKTLMALLNAVGLYQAGEIDSLLVFAPNGVHSNWVRNEIPKHMPDGVDYRSCFWRAGAGVRHQREIDQLMLNFGGKLRIFAVNWEALQNKKGRSYVQRS